MGFGSDGWQHAIATKASGLVWECVRKAIGEGIRGGRAVEPSLRRSIERRMTHALRSEGQHYLCVRWKRARRSASSLMVPGLSAPIE